MNILTKEFKRTARHNWYCDQCHNVILAGEVMWSLYDSKVF